MNTKRNVTLNPSDLQRNYEDLANAIVVQAVIDYKRSNKDTEVHKLRRESIKEFFHSELFGLICPINPDEFIKQIETCQTAIKLPDLECD